MGLETKNIGKSIKMSNNKKKSIIVVWALIFLDVLIKVIIAHFFMEKEVLINNRLGFLPYLNQEQLSILNID